jgi:hypothetical protein
MSSYFILPENFYDEIRVIVDHIFSLFNERTFYFCLPEIHLSNDCQVFQKIVIKYF